MKRIQGQGFTFLELVLVIVVMGVLGALAIPRFMNMTQEAKIAENEAVKGALRLALAKAKTKQLDAGGVENTLKIGGTGEYCLDYLLVSNKGVTGAIPLYSGDCDEVTNAWIPSGTALDEALAHCAHIFGALLWNTPITIGHLSETYKADPLYGCDGKTYCVDSGASETCTYKSLSSGEIILYKFKGSDTGMVY